MPQQAARASGGNPPARAEQEKRRAAPLQVLDLQYNQTAEAFDGLARFHTVIHRAVRRQAELNRDSETRARRYAGEIPDVAAPRLQTYEEAAEALANALAALNAPPHIGEALERICESGREAALRFRRTLDFVSEFAELAVTSAEDQIEDGGRTVARKRAVTLLEAFTERGIISAEMELDEAEEDEIVICGAIRRFVRRCGRNVRRRGRHYAENLDERGGQVCFIHDDGVGQQNNRQISHAYVG